VVGSLSDWHKLLESDLFMRLHSDIRDRLLSGCIFKQDIINIAVPGSSADIFLNNNITNRRNY